MTSKILALETSGTGGSVAALSGNEVLRELLLDPALRSAKSLAPAIRELLSQVGWHPRELELIALPTGPGSFTGLRVGVMTAKTLAYATGAQVLGLGTLEVIAQQAPPIVEPLVVVLDAQRKQLFVQSFARDGQQRWRAITAVSIENIDEWLVSLQFGTVVTGPPLGRLRGRLPTGVSTADPSLWDPRASTVGRLAAERFAAGMHDDVWSLAPNYHRRSAAEEKRDGC
jgi:tRNA threonylcarbamoyladenosine biosynthesis protein TsaB